MRPYGSHPYWQYVGVEPHRYAYEWYGGAGGVLQSGITQPRIGAEARGLGIFDLEECYVGPGNCTPPFPAFKKTILHRRATNVSRADPMAPWAIGDQPLLRPAGPEPMDPNEGTYKVLCGLWDGLSDNEKLLAGAGAAVGVWWLWKRSKRRRRRNPANPRGRYVVRSSSHGVTGSISFTKKKDAQSYAAYLRRSGKRARVAKR